MRGAAVPLLLAAALGALLLAAAPAQAAPTRLAATGDAALDALAPGNFTGSGTPADPYVIREWVLRATDAPAIDLRDTTRHVVLEGVHVSSGGTRSDAVRLTNVTNVTLRGSTVETSRTGVLVERSTGVVLSGNVVKSSQTGIHLVDASGVTLEDNRVSINDKDVRFTRSAGNLLLRNNLSIATGQFGLWFDDARSYENAIDATNVVNAVPVRWYANLSGTPEAPLVLAGADVPLTGVTNVAQVVVHGSSHVVLQGAVAKAGLAAPGAAGTGLLVHQSANVTVAGGLFEGNAGAGARVVASDNVTLADATVRGNRAAGVALVGGGNGTLRRVDVRDNALQGVLLDHVRNASVLASTLRANAGGQVEVLQSDANLTGNTLVGPSPVGVHLRASRAALRDNALDNHTDGVRFTASAGSEAWGNRILMRDGQTGLRFDDEASYDNGIDPTNLVNGVPVRWYTRLNGTAAEPVRIEGARVELKGITNVAQVMVHRSENVTLASPAAANGSAAGIRVHRSHGVLVAGGNASGNAGHGLHASQSPDLRLQETRLRSNGGDGARVESSPRPVAQSVVAETNRGDGVRVAGSEGAVLRGVASLLNLGAGVRLSGGGSAPSLVESGLMEGNNGGILVEGAAIGAVRRNEVRENGEDGIALAAVPAGARLESNEVEGHARGIRFTQTHGAEAVWNNVTFGARQTAYWFSDEASYNNTLDTTNTANGQPLWWVVRAVGTPAAPFVMDHPVSELRGVTNVAQVAIVKSSHVRVAGALAANGTALGVLVLHSDNVTLDAPRALNNSGTGVEARFSPDARLASATLQANGQHGARFASSPRADVDAALAAQNGGRGVVLESSPGSALRNATARGNQQAGLAVLASPGAATRVEDNVVAGNAGGVLVEASNATPLARNDVSGNGEYGLRLAAWDGRLDVRDNLVANHSKGLVLASLKGANLSGNRVAIGPDQTGFHFADEASYDNDLATSNLVNDVPLQWHTRAKGLALQDVRSDLRGITNVAQVMLYRVEGATLENVTTRNGLGAGLVVWRSTDVRVNGSTSEANDGDGVLLQDAERVRLENLTLRDGRGDGVDQRRGRADVLASLVEGHAGAGLRSEDAAHVGLRNSTLARNQAGAVLTRAAHAEVAGNVLSSNRGPGVHLVEASAGATVEKNRVQDHPQGVRLTRTQFAAFRENEVHMLAGQTGVHFDDESSYDNDLPPSNLVNGVPLRWYTGLAGKEGEPVDVGDVRVELPGITNVAQVMVHRSAYVRLANVTATNGTGVGLLLHRSSNVAVEGANVSGSAVGAHLRLAQSSTLRDVAAYGTSTAVRLSDSRHNDVRRVLASGGEGVTLDAVSTDNRVEDVDGTGRGVADPSASHLRGNNLLADAGAPKRVRVNASVVFGDALATARFESQRVVSQAWDFGDGQRNVSTLDAPFRPAHAYAAPGTYRASLVVTTADNETLHDNVTVDVVLPLSAPRNVVAAFGERNVTLAWLAPLHDGGSPVLSYRVYRGPNASGLQLLAETTGRAHVDGRDLVNGRPYLYAVSAVTADGEGPRSDVALVVPAAKPGAPLGLQAAPGRGSVALSWRAPADAGGLPVTGYVVLRAEATGNLTPLAHLSDATAYLDAGAHPDRTYAYAVQAVNALGAGPATPRVVVPPASPPGPPLGLVALGGDASVGLAWSPPATLGGADVQTYHVYRGVSPGTMRFLAAVGNATTYRDAGLPNGRAYHYAVSAMNAWGEGNRSEPASATPTAVDALRPVLLSRVPAPDASLRSGVVEVSARFLDNVGVTTVELFVDGRSTLAATRVTPTSVAYAVPEALAPGVHQARLLLRDAAGNALEESWSFRVLSPQEMAPDLAWSDLAAQPAEATEGAPVTVTARVRNGGDASVTLPVPLVWRGATLAVANVTLEPGAEAEAAWAFLAPPPGEGNLTAGNATAPFRVLAPDAEAPPAPEEAPPAEEDPPEETSRLPWGGPAAVVAALGLGAWLRRRGR